jgi:hypothetical protein
MAITQIPYLKNTEMIHVNREKYNCEQEKTMTGITIIALFGP